MSGVLLEEHRAYWAYGAFGLLPNLFCWGRMRVTPGVGEEEKSMNIKKVFFPLLMLLVSPLVFA